MKVLVTGGAGYVGGVSVDALLAAGHEVVVLDDLSTGHRAIPPSAARLVVGTYADEAATRTLLEEEGVEAILHCAARSLVGESVADPARYYRDNVAGGVALLEAARVAGVRRLVFSSTAAVYGVPDTTPITEDAQLRPINAYGETKRTFEGALHWYGVAYGVRSVILRYFNVAGATERLGEVHHPETHLIPNLLAAVEGGPPLTLFGDDYPTEDGTPVRDYIHVSDLADAHLAALEGRPTIRRSRWCATWARRTGSPSGRSWRQRRRSWGARSRMPWDPGARATRLSSWPPTPGRESAWAGRPDGPPWRRCWGRRGRGGRRIRTATTTDTENRASLRVVRNPEQAQDW